MPIIAKVHAPLSRINNIDPVVLWSRDVPHILVVHFVVVPVPGQLDDVRTRLVVLQPSATGFV